MVPLFIYAFSYNVLSDLYAPKGKTPCAMISTVYTRRIRMSPRVKFKVWWTPLSGKIFAFAHIFKLQNWKNVRS